MVSFVVDIDADVCYLFFHGCPSFFSNSLHNLNEVTSPRCQGWTSIPSDRGLLSFKRYVAVAVVARNILKIGTILIQKERKSPHRLIEAA